MTTATGDVHEVLAFGREKLARHMLRFALVAAGVGVVGVAVGGDDRALTVVSWGLIVFGVGLAGWEFSKSTIRQEPLLTLLPEGIILRFDGVEAFLIPWSEVRGVDSITVTGWRGATFDNVTVVLVSMAFYEHVIDVGSFFSRGPGWGATFIPAGDLMQVALHHEILPVSADDLLAAVEARWRAFGAPAEPSASGS